MIGTMLDNKRNGTVGDAVSPYLKKGNKVSIMASLFSIHAYDFLKKELNDVESVRLLLSEPAFTNGKKTVGNTVEDIWQRENILSGTTQEYFLRNNLSQAKIAKECADWIKAKVEVKAMVESSPGLNVSISQNSKNEGVTIQGNSNFTAEGLGFVSSSALHMNTSTSETHGYIKLKKASEFVLGVVEETGMTSLFSLGQSALLQNAATSSDDFEMISFLIIK